MNPFRWLARLWNSWEPQPTWQEALRLIVIESAGTLAFIYAFEAIF